MKIIERIKAWLDAPVEVYDPSKPRPGLHIGYLVTQISRDAYLRPDHIGIVYTFDDAQELAERAGQFRDCTYYTTITAFEMGKEDRGQVVSVVNHGRNDPNG